MVSTKNIGVRLNAADLKLVKTLTKQLGARCANFTHLFRLALRALAEKEGLQS